MGNNATKKMMRFRPVPHNTIGTAVQCPVGRLHRADNVTCQSCIRQGVVCLQAEGKKTKVERQILTTTSGCVLITTQYLYGMNHWHGRPLYVYLEQRRAWEKVLAGTWALWGVQEKEGGKRFLMVRRFVANSRCLVKDKDNLIGAMKPLKDILVTQRVFKDDQDCFLDFDIKQEIDKENPRVELEVWAL